MEHCEILRPLFSYVAHLAVSADDMAPCACDPSVIRRDLEHLIGTTRALLPQNGEDAWCAFSAWMTEMLDGTPAGADLTRAVLSVPGDWESGFYQRLNQLLHRHDSRRPHPGDLATIEVFSLCLDLGFRGYYARPGFEHHLAGYRSRCREILAAEAGGGESAGVRQPHPSRARNLAIAAAMWTAPAAVTVLLYALYRLLLSDLYSTILG